MAAESGHRQKPVGLTSQKWQQDRDELGLVGIPSSTEGETVAWWIWGPASCGYDRGGQWLWRWLEYAA